MKRRAGPDQNVMSDPTPPGPFSTSWGPLDGPIRDDPYIPTLGVLADPDGWPVGMATPDGRLDHPRGAVATFRLVVAKVELPGRYVCVGRRFVEEADWAGGLA